MDFSEGYYDVDQALVSVRGSPIAGATSLDELRHAALGAPNGTASLAYIEDTIRPSRRPIVFDDLGAAVRGLEDGTVHGIVADLPTASHSRRNGSTTACSSAGSPPGSPGAVRDGVRAGEPDRGLCEPRLREMKEDGTLDELRRAWLADGAETPLIEG